MAKHETDVLEEKMIYYPKAGGLDVADVFRVANRHMAEKLTAYLAEHEDQYFVIRMRKVGYKLNVYGPEQTMLVLRCEITQSDAATQWISVDVEMPPVGETVLLYTAQGCKRFNRAGRYWGDNRDNPKGRNKQNFQIFGELGPENETVIAWAKYPAPELGMFNE